jgi:hypothetical protein
MSGRKLVCAVSALAFALVFVAAAPAKKPPPGGTSPPPGPTNLRITASSTYSLSLAWDPAKTSSSNWWYCVQVDGSGCYRVDPPQTTFTRSGLMPGRTTTWTVVAVDSSGHRSAPSNSVTFTTPPDTTAPSPAPSLTLISAYPTRISVAWTASTDDTSQVSYTVWVDGAQHLELFTSPATLLRVTPQTTHEFRVTARDAYGNAAESNVLTVTTPTGTETVPPTAPTNLTLGPESSSPEAWLSWTQSTDDTDPQSEILYDVYLDGERNDDGVIGYGSTVTYCRSHTGPTTIVVKAVDTSGNVSAASNEIVFDC